MKNTNSSPENPTPPGELRVVVAKAQNFEKAAQAAKAQARRAKRHFKEYRKLFKQAKRAAREAAKLAFRAREELKACLEKFPKTKRRPIAPARHAAPGKAVFKLTALTRNSAKRRARPRRASVLRSATGIPGDSEAVPSTQSVNSAA